MLLREQLAFTLIGSPVHGLAEGLRSALQARSRKHHPELREIYLEGARVKELIDRVVKPGMNCVDVGCHLGSVLSQVVKLSPTGRHVAIEPLPHKADWLRKRYRDVEVHRIAVGDQPGILDFYYDAKHSGFSGLRPHGAGVKTPIRVECRRLDDVVPAGREVGFLKIDVEGGELGVLRGGRRVVAEGRPVILFECTQSGLATFEIGPRDVVDLIEGELGYSIYLIKDYLAGAPPLDLDALTAAITYPFAAFNFVAAPRPL